MQTSESIHPILIYKCSHAEAWYRDIEPVILHVADSGDPNEWYIVSGEHKGKHVAKADCTTAVQDISA